MGILSISRSLCPKYPHAMAMPGVANSVLLRMQLRHLTVWLVLSGGIAMVPHMQADQPCSINLMCMLWYVETFEMSLRPELRSALGLRCSRAVPVTELSLAE